MEPEVWSAGEVSERLKSGEDLVLVDVREVPELEICRVEESLHIPLGEIRERHSELPRDKTIVCYCHHGMRSEMAAYELLSAGFAKVVNLSGGIDAWALEVEPEMVRY